MPKLIRPTAAMVWGALLLSTAQPAQAQFVAGPPLNQHDYVDFVGEMNTAVALALNDVFDLTSEVTLTSGSCGQANAFYVPGDSQILLCTELIASFFGQPNQQQPGIAAFSQMMFTLFHEVGHALIDVLDLPVVGQEEDAVDQIAVLMMSEEPVMAMWAAGDFWKQSRAPLGIDAFADAHDLNQQRFYNISCWWHTNVVAATGQRVGDHGAARFLRLLWRPHRQ